MLSSKLFPWQKNKKKSTVYKNEKNEELIQELRSEGITDEKILTAIRMVPRELFTEKLDEAYENKALSVECGQTLTQPFCTAYMASFLNLRKTDNILDIDLERAVELIAKPTIRGNATLKNFGEHPQEKKEITAHDGKYGTYVKCGRINASLLGDQTVSTLSLEDAIKLINDRKVKLGQKVSKKKIK